jgi:hypothetical protein
MRGILDDWRAVGGSFKSRWEVWALLMTLYSIHVGGSYEVHDYAAFVVEVTKFFSRKKDASDCDYGSALSAWHATDPARRGKKPTKSGYFSHWVTNSDVADSRNKWMTPAIGNLVEELLANGVIGARTIAAAA